VHASGTVVVVTVTVVVEDVVEDVVVVVVGAAVVVVVATGHGQLSSVEPPTATARHTSASLAVVGSVPLGAHVHAGAQTSAPTATFRMKRQSLATGAAPVLTGCAQSPRSADTGGAAATAAASSATIIETIRTRRATRVIERVLILMPASPPLSMARTP